MIGLNPLNQVCCSNKIILSGYMMIAKVGLNPLNQVCCSNRIRITKGCLRSKCVLIP